MSTEAERDAILEAEGWKQTASKWRSRALQEGGRWRHQCAKLEADLDTANERGANLAEEIVGLKADLKERLTKAESKSLRREVEIAVRDASATHRAREEASLAKQARDVAYGEKDRAVKAAGTDRLKMQEERDRMLAALRVVAERLQVSWRRKELENVHDLVAAVDQALVDALSK
jgi:hypothetical protein